MANRSTVAWLIALVALSLAWFPREVRGLVIGQLWLHVTLAVLCASGAIVLSRLPGGSSRLVTIVLLGIACWGAAILWQFWTRPLPHYFGWPNALIAGIGVMVVPLLVATLLGTAEKLGTPSAAWIAAKVATLVFVAAPLSNAIALSLIAVILREGL